MDKKKPKILDLRELLNKQQDKNTIIPRTVTTETVTQAKKLPKAQLLRTAQEPLNVEVDVAEAKGELSQKDAQEARQVIANPDKKVKKNSVAGKFTDALAAFAPDLIGLAVGGILGGAEGAVEGFKFGKEAGQLGRDIQQQEFDNEQTRIGNELRAKNSGASLLTAETNAAKFKAKQQEDQLEQNTPTIDENFIIANDPTFSPVRQNGRLFHPSTGQELSQGDIKPLGAVAENRKATTSLARQEDSDLRIGQSFTRIAQKDRDFAFKEDNKNDFSDAQVNTIQEQERGLGILSNIRDLKSKVNTGPVAGRKQSILQKAGKADANFVRLQAAAGQQLSSYLKQQSGVSVSEQEVQRLLKTIPNVNDSDGDFDAKLAQFETELRQAQNRFIKNIEKFQGKKVQGRVPTQETPRQRLNRLRKSRGK